MNNVDVIIIGAGINSLVVASILSKAGKNILLLESREKIGGMASTEEFAPGFKCNIINLYASSFFHYFFLFHSMPCIWTTSK